MNKTFGESMSSMSNWMPKEAMSMMVPLTEKYVHDNFILHYYTGFDINMALNICIDMTENMVLTDPINIYLYIVDYPHDFTNLDRKGSNNGFTQRVGTNYSIVVFRKLFWAKVLIHELLHVAWMLNNLPISREFPKWDEAIIESHAVRLAIQKGYINEAQYKYYLNQSKSRVVELCGGYSNLHDTLKYKQKTALYEYLFLSDGLSKIFKS